MAITIGSNVSIGGNITIGDQPVDNYLRSTTVTFNSSGTLTLPSNIIIFKVSVLLIGGGGGAGGYQSGNILPGGGGGAGGYIYVDDISSNVAPGGSYTVIIGGGGTPGSIVGSGDASSGTNGVDSTAFGYTAYGGGYGGGVDDTLPLAIINGGNGGSGGGAGRGNIYNVGGTAVSGQGYNGGNGAYGGSGGGAGGVGAQSTSNPTPGGAGITNSISGTSVTYSVGGPTRILSSYVYPTSPGSGGYMAVDTSGGLVGGSSGIGGICIVKYIYIQ
jgi:hypothetical protein